MRLDHKGDEMKPLSDQDHYEILEGSRDATREEIERSFRMAEAIYAEDDVPDELKRASRRQFGAEGGSA